MSKDRKGEKRGEKGLRSLSIEKQCPYAPHDRKNGKNRGSESFGKRSAPMPLIRVLGIDPGLKGALVLIDGVDLIESYEMPVKKERGEERVCWEPLREMLGGLTHRFPGLPVFIERAKPMAMGSKYAFSYGRDYQTLLLAVWWVFSSPNDFRPVLVEPSAWAKEMHEGISKDLRPKAKSLLAVKKLFPSLVGRLPRKPKGALQDGPVDALLIAGYGVRALAYEAQNF